MLASESAACYSSPAPQKEDVGQQHDLGPAVCLICQVSDRRPSKIRVHFAGDETTAFADYLLRSLGAGEPRYPH